MKKLTVILLVSMQPLFAQIQFEAKVRDNKTTMGVNENVFVEFIMDDTDGENFTQPDFTDFEVLAGPSRIITQTSMAGKKTFKQAYVFRLKPLRQGILEVGPATIEYNGQVYESQPLKISVTAEVQIKKTRNAFGQ